MDNSEILNKVEILTGKKLTCVVPFEHLMIFPNGEVCSCCPALVNHYKLGNIFEQNFEEIWNGKKATVFRKSVLDGNFQFCNLKSCLSLKNIRDDVRYNSGKEQWQNIINRTMPKEVHFNIDVCCNVRCIMCRDKHEYSPENVEKFFAIMDDVLIPLLREAEIVYIDGAGELFASELSKTLIKKITSTFPSIKFNLITNGVLANEKIFEELNLLGKIKSIEVSVHSVTKKTYNKIVRDGDFDKVMENLKFLSRLKKTGKIEFFWLNFVVTSYNYKELIKFQKFAESIGAMTNIWEYRKWGNAGLDYDYEKVAVFEPFHPDYQKFVKIIQNDIFKTNNCNVNNKLKPLEK